VIQVGVRTPNSPFQNVDAKTLKMTEGRIHAQDKSPDTGVPFQDILALRNLVGLDGHAKTDTDANMKRFSTHSLGAHFCEISFDPGIARLRITRWLTIIDGGRMINAKTARNQILGGVVMGIGMGLFEATVYDTRNGHPINNNLADYIVPVNADIPEMDCIFLDYPDNGVKRIWRPRHRRDWSHRRCLRANVRNLSRYRRPGPQPSDLHGRFNRVGTIAS
jgi:xanthine dehydrogenase YagR molybdenum-binding subunit